MASRQEILWQKSAEIQKLLEEWASENFILKAGERIEFSMQIVVVPTVVPEKIQNKEILSMKWCEFFTAKRLQKFNISVASKVLGLAGKEIDWDSSLRKDRKPPISLNTIGDLLQCCAGDVIDLRGIGITTINAMKEILKSEGIEWN